MTAGTAGLDTGRPLYYVGAQKDNTPRDESLVSYVFKGETDYIKLLASTDPLSRVIDNNKGGVVLLDQVTLLESLPHLYSIGKKDSTSNITEGSVITIIVDLNLEDYSIIPAVSDLHLPIHIGLESINLEQNGIYFINFNRINGTQTANNIFTSGAASPKNLIINLSQYYNELVKSVPEDVAIFNITEYKKNLLPEILANVPSSITRINLLQGSSTASENQEYEDGFEPFLLDFFADFEVLVQNNIQQLLLTKIGNKVDDFNSVSAKIISNLESAKPVKNLFVGEVVDISKDVTEDYSNSIKNILKLEDAYIKVLKQLLGNNLSIINEYSNSTINTLSPEFGYGRYLQEKEIQNKLVELARKSLDPQLFHSQESDEFVKKLSKWVSFKSSSLDQNLLEEANKIGSDIFEYLKTDAHSQTAIKLLEVAENDEKYFQFKSSWLIGSDAWSYDLGNSGVHQVLTSSDNINMLIIDSEP